MSMNPPLERRILAIVTEDPALAQPGAGAPVILVASQQEKEMTATLLSRALQAAVLELANGCLVVAHV